ARTEALALPEEINPRTNRRIRTHKNAFGCARPAVLPIAHAQYAETKSMSDRNAADRPPTWLELESVKPIREPETITGLYRDTLKRRYPKLVRQLSDRRYGMQLKDCLAIAAGE